MFHEGLKIGPYILIRTLGKGGFGEVWLAEKQTQFVTKKVAVKLPHDDQVDLDEISREATLWEQASGHPNVLPIIDADIYDGQVVIVSEYADGGSLADELKRSGRFPVEHTLKLIIGILEGLEFLHSRQIIHRDIKPQNILLQGGIPRLADFGISRAMSASNTSSVIIGTDAYMAPEAFEGQRNVKTDLWSVGVMFYQLLKGSLPFPAGNPSERMYAIFNKEFEPLPEFVPTELKRIIDSALAKYPAARFNSAREMQESLRRFPTRGNNLFVPSEKEQRPIKVSIPIQTAIEDKETVAKPQPEPPANKKWWSRLFEGRKSDASVRTAPVNQFPKPPEKIEKIEEVKKNESQPPKIHERQRVFMPQPLENLNKVVEDEQITVTQIKETDDQKKFKFIPPKPFLPVATKIKAQNFDNYILPTPDFLIPPSGRVEQSDEELLTVAQELTERARQLNVTGRIVHILQGPVITTYEFEPELGVKYSRIVGIAEDLCMALRAESVRIDRVPGKPYVGIEVPNQKRETIFLREIIESKNFQLSGSKLTIALGKTISGLNYSVNLAEMPHLLIAGEINSGKSIFLHTIITSILYKVKPDEVKLILIDPKGLEFSLYKDIPHLATPIITTPERAAMSLKWAVSEMENRYKYLAGWGVRNINGFNTEVKKLNGAQQFDDNGEPWKILPYLVIVIDELADLMMAAGKEVEESITRVAQMARSVGIHLVLSTQRPSVNVITGLIKSNIPARISFRFTSKIDSRTILDAGGSEELLGKGDMLFLPPATSQAVRVHGAFVDENEITRIVEHIKAQGKPEYDTSITKTEEEFDDSGDLPGKRDPLFMDALRSVISAKRASTSLLQRHLRIGYGRAAAILDAMVREGFIGEMDGGSRARPILKKAYEFLEGYDSAGEL